MLYDCLYKGCDGCCVFVCIVTCRACVLEV